MDSLNYRASAAIAAMALSARTGPLMLRAAGAALRKALVPALAAPTGVRLALDSSVVESELPLEVEPEVVEPEVVEPPVTDEVAEEPAAAEELVGVVVEVDPVKQEESVEALTVMLPDHASSSLESAMEIWTTLPAGMATL